MDVVTWLKNLGLDQYEAAFRDNAIDEEVLPRLTAEDLKDLGVALVGHRRKLLDAIAALRAEAPEVASPAAPGSTPPPAAPPPRPSEVVAERRPITVMFCDLVGSTSLTAKMDAEDWRNLVSAYLDAASAAVASFGGHVLKKLGDGLMALFGYPQAQENDAERAVRAALAIQGALVEVNARNAAKGLPELAARIGLDSGPVVMDAAGEVFGEAPNVAARVQGAAAPGAVIVTGAVQRQVAGLFVAEDEGAHELKGVPEPIRLYRIIRVSGGRRGGARALTPLVGRAEELDLLGRRWERARKGEGQLVLIIGEPGIGKSRLIEEFRSRLVETPHTWVEWSSSQLLQNTPLHPIAEWGRMRFGTNAPADQRLADLENTVKLIGLDPAEDAPLLAPLVDIPLPPGRAVQLPPEELRRRQLATLTAFVLAGARSQAVALAFEDLHWADPTSLDLMQALAERGAQAPLFLIATARPEFRPPWSLRSHHSVISLSPLDRAGVARMVGELASRHALSDEMIERVRERTGGVPLFVEEVTRLLLERGVEGGAQEIPPTLQQSLAARLDRLGEAREVAQIGALLGRDFSYALLAAVTAPVAAVDDRGPAPVDAVDDRVGRAQRARLQGDRGPVGGVAAPAPALQSALDRLVDADLLFVEGAPPQATYRFKHALIQDAAYESLLKSRRQALHRRAAEILRDDPERAAAEPELVAHHFTKAGLDDLAIEWWGKAGDQALRRSAFQEAIAHLGKAIGMADRAGGATSERGAKDAAASSQRLKLQTDYGQAVAWSRGFAAEETKTAFARVDQISSATGDAAARVIAYDAEFLGSFMRGEYRKARETAEAFLREAAADGRHMEIVGGYRTLGLVLLFQGDLKGARSILERISAFIREGESETQSRFGRVTEVNTAAYLALAEWHLGEVDRARSHIEQAIRRANEFGNPLTVVSAFLWKIVLEGRRNDVSAALLGADALLALTEKLGIETHSHVGHIYASWAHGRLHDPEAGASALRQALAAYMAQGNRTAAPSAHGMLAELEAANRGFDSAFALIDQGLAIAEETGEHLTDAYLHRLRGELLLLRDPANPVPAEQAFKTAIAVAKEQGARSYELLASFSLAKLYHSTGRPAEARAALAPALEGFSPTPGMPEIAEAEALLAALEANEPDTADLRR